MFWTVVAWVLLALAAVIFLRGFIGMWMPSLMSPKGAPPLPWWKFALMAWLGPIGPLLGAIVVFALNAG